MRARGTLAGLRVLAGRAGIFGAVLCAFCPGSAPAVPEEGDVSRQDLLQARYSLPDGDIRLLDGEYRERYDDDSGGELVVHLGPVQAYGDIDEDGRGEAVTTLILEPGGSGPFVYLAAVSRKDGMIRSGECVLLGDNIKVESLEIRERLILAAWLTHALGDSACCPTLGVGNVYLFTEGRLVPSMAARPRADEEDRSNRGAEPPAPAGAGGPELYVAPPPRGSASGDGSAERPFADLHRALAAAIEGTSIRLEPGRYTLAPIPWDDPTCGNCEDPEQTVPATVGIHLRGKRISLVGAPGHESIIETHSGYGILVRDCEDCALLGLVVTGGERDTSGRATDAAVVVQRSSVRIEDCWIRDNIGDSTVVARTVVGIMGITGREGSRMEIRGNRITRNSWDAIALYRDAEASIVDNVVDGVDLALGGTIGGGRGVGIGLTWNARGTVHGNLVRRYWKGIGVFLDAQAEVEDNVVEEIATWGLSLWDAGRGRPRAHFRFNVVDSTGACGAMIARESPEPPPAGSLAFNAFTRTGQNPKYDMGEPYCMQRALALHAAPDDFTVEGNFFHENREPRDTPGSLDQSVEVFRRRLLPLLERLAPSAAVRESRFFKRFESVLEPLEVPLPPAAGTDSGSRSPEKSERDSEIRP